MRTGALITGSIATLALVLAACGHATPRPANKPSAAPVAVAAPSTAPSCLDQFIAWRDNGGGSQIQAIGTDLTQDSTAASAGNLGEVQGAVTILASDAQTALGNPPPACVPQMSTDYTTAMNDFIAAAASISQGTTDGIQLATTQITAGGDALVRATRDLRHFERNN